MQTGEVNPYCSLLLRREYVNLNAINKQTTDPARGWTERSLGKPGGVNVQTPCSPMLCKPAILLFTCSDNTNIVAIAAPLAS